MEFCLVAHNSHYSALLLPFCLAGECKLLSRDRFMWISNSTLWTIVPIFFAIEEQNWWLKHQQKKNAPKTKGVEEAKPTRDFIIVAIWKSFADISIITFSMWLSCFRAASNSNLLVEMDCEVVWFQAILMRECHPRVTTTIYFLE